MGPAYGRGHRSESVVDYSNLRTEEPFVRGATAPNIQHQTGRDEVFASERRESRTTINALGMV
jgi:hypothetical protein